jgi:hypothetical protein
MKTFVRQAAALLAITVACQAGLAWAEDAYWVSDSGPSAIPTGNEKVTSQGQSCCPTCGPTVCGNECGESGLSLVGLAGFDAFKGISDGSYPSNFGVLTGLNAGVPLFALGEYGFGWQIGLSYGVYDIDGRYTANQASSQQQTFITTGFYRKAGEDRQLSFGLVYDWMVNENWGVYATTPTLGQWRAQVEWAVSDCNAFGMWGCVRDNVSRQLYLRQTLVASRAVSQANFFWHHEFCCTKADSYLWTGCTQNDRLNGDGSLSDWVIGASVEVPLSSRLALYANAQYVHPTAAASTTAAVEDCYNVGMGIVWYFGGHACDRSITNKYGPYMPVANNSTFLVDQNPTQ